MKPKLIFFGNGPLADFTLTALLQNFDLLFRARSAQDLAQVAAVKQQHPEAFGILASFGVIIRQDMLDLFEPTGIINLHPSLLPKYRGPSPIETAILNGDTTFGVSIMKLAKDMDAGPIFYQTTTNFSHQTDKNTIYQSLATLGATWLNQNIANLPTPTTQDHAKATYTAKLDTSLSLLDPIRHSAEALSHQIRAFQKFPKSRYEFYGQDCIIIEAHVESTIQKTSTLSLKCQDGQFLVIDQLQPAGRKIMTSTAFQNGYKNHR